MSRFQIAWRNVWRSRRRSLVTVAAMSLALLIMILYAGLMEGYLQAMEAQVLEVQVGDLQAFALDYRRDPSVHTRIEHPERILAPLDEAGFPASPRLLGWGLGASGDASAGVSLRGIEVVRERRVSTIHQQLERGRWLEPGDAESVVLGRRLARTLGIEPGGELFVLSQGADGGMAYALYRVRGVLGAIGDATDRSAVFMTSDAFRELMGVPEGVHQIVVRRPEALALASAALWLRELAPELDVQTWRQLMPTVASLIDSARSIMLVMFSIVYVAIGILILNAMLMAVFERIRELGVLKALGAGPGEVLSLILLECAIQTGLALIVGLLLSLPGLLYLTRVGIDLGLIAGTSVMGIALADVWRAVVTPSVFIGPIGVLLAIVALAVIYPALKAAAIDPVEAMRHH